MKSSQHIIQCDHPNCTAKFLEYGMNGAGSWGHERPSRSPDPNYCLRYGFRCEICTSDLCPEHCFCASAPIHASGDLYLNSCVYWFGPICYSCLQKVCNFVEEVREDFRQRIVMAVKPPGVTTTQPSTEKDVLDMIRE